MPSSSSSSDVALRALTSSVDALEALEVNAVGVDHCLEARPDG